MKRNKRGWIRVVEAFIALLLITSVLLIVINKGYLGKENISSKIYGTELAVLREIELDDGLRSDVLKVEENNLPVEWEDSDFPPSIKKKIIERIPTYLSCMAKICEMDEVCTLDEYLNKEIYAQAVAIVANSETYSPRQLKMFCWIR